MDLQRVMVVEDHTVTRRGLKNFLESAYPELEVEEARNGREAVDRVAENPSELIVMDMVMPYLDGARATVEIKAGWPEVIIILLLLDPGQGSRALDSGADAYLLKEGEPGELLALIEELCTSSSDFFNPNDQSSSEQDEPIVIKE